MHSSISQIREKFSNIEYLRAGNEKQRAAWDVLSGTGLFGMLEIYEPVLAGTIPIGIDVEGSDLDIVCRYTRKENFVHDMESRFASEKGFSLNERIGTDIILCRFDKGGFPVEIYASLMNPSMSNAFRHMISEYRILRLAPPQFRKDIIDLKNEGVKTEPAFAKLLRLDGNPYEAMTLLEYWTDHKIQNTLNVSYAPEINGCK